MIGSRWDCKLWEGIGIYLFGVPVFGGYVIIKILGSILKSIDNFFLIKLMYRHYKGDYSEVSEKNFDRAINRNKWGFQKKIMSYVKMKNLKLNEITR